MNWDSRLDNFGIKSVSTPNAKWSLLSAVFQDETEAQGNHIVLFNIKDAQGNPCEGIPCFVDWVGRDPTDMPTKAVTDKTGTANVPIYANLDITKKNGPYFAYVEDKTKSDLVTGMGLPEHHHVNYVLTFGPAAEPTPPPPPPPQTLEDAVLTAAKGVTWMPVNNGAALWNFAKANGLQDQQTDEIHFTYDGKNYVAQVFNLGIVYAQEGDWGNIKFIPK